MRCSELNATWHSLLLRNEATKWKRHSVAVSTSTYPFGCSKDSLSILEASMGLSPAFLIWMPACDSCSDSWLQLPSNIDLERQQSWQKSIYKEVLAPSSSPGKWAKTWKHALSSVYKYIHTNKQANVCVCDVSPCLSNNKILANIIIGIAVLLKLHWNAAGRWGDRRERVDLCLHSLELLHYSSAVMVFLASCAFPGHYVDEQKLLVWHIPLGITKILPQMIWK